MDYYCNNLVSLFWILPFKVSFQVHSSRESGKCPALACFQHDCGVLPQNSLMNHNVSWCVFNRPPPCSDLSYLSALLYIRPKVFFVLFFGCVLMCITVVLLKMQKKEKKLKLLLKDSAASIQRHVLWYLHRLEILFLLRFLSAGRRRMRISDLSAMLRLHSTYSIALCFSSCNKSKRSQSHFSISCSSLICVQRSSKMIWIEMTKYFLAIYAYLNEWALAIFCKSVL